MSKPIVSFLIEKIANGYTGYAQAFNIPTEGDTVQVVYANAHEALAEQCAKPGETPADFTVSFRYDIPAFFEVYPVISISALGTRVGMNNSLISQYIASKKTPGPKQRAKIGSGIHELAQELSQLSFV